ncbi:chromosome partitioning protein ParA [Rhizobium rhizosphaerae]|uniref:non-specific protein-tyrosine kinase n=1 Tax=Xaviernesmea rhizosphaerae TaxID=1672749 RepID=A0A1Q9ACH5_9HYPH|nr:polysaccharide biosynthesis tyrosine autokinase [Xaviernesmea rhizosphaerae]OLP52599.1 chromosome partitioning protein ParA [Xaviernesmea rhizosphaerae]
MELDWIFGIARRQWRVVAICVFLAVAGGIAYLVTALPLYTAQTSLLIGSMKNQFVEQLAMNGNGSIVEDENALLSQIEVLNSEAVGNAVIDKLKLDQDPFFMKEKPSLISTLLAPVRAAITALMGSKPEDNSPEKLRQDALKKLSDNMSVVRVGKSYVLNVGFTSPSPEFAARVANAIGDAYVLDKLNSKYDSARRAGDWIQERVVELRQKVLESDMAVQRFRAANNLVSTGTQLVSEQQLTELNTALITAQSETARARARLARIESILSNGQSDAIVTDVLDSSVSTELRKKYLDAAKMEGEISKKLGPDHQQAVRLRAEMAEYKRLMFEELNRIAESYRSDLKVAEAREQSLQDSVSQASSVSASANETQVQLRELERENETYRNLYQNFLQNYQVAIQQQTFPVTEDRIISRAMPPEKASFPKKPLVLAVFLVMGAAVGTGIGALREFRDRFFRTGTQVRSELGLEFLGNAPLLKGDSNADQAGAPADPRLISKGNAVSNYVLDHPLSAFAEALRSAKISADMSITGKNCKTIGIVSSLPGEGKSTISINFAELLANQGARTVLIDADLRNPGLTRAIGRHATVGLLDVLLADKDPMQAMLVNPTTRLSFLPAVVRQRVPHSSELLASAAMGELLQKLSHHYDYIVMDLPPLGPVVDARAAAPRIDGFLYVIEWGRTSRRLVRNTLRTEQAIADKCLGVVMNKVDLDKMRLYATEGSDEYYHAAYSAYYQKG